MHKLNLKTWARYEQFKLFIGMDYPHFNLCANVDITEFLPAAKASPYSFSTCLVYLLARAANEIPEFRYRIQGVDVVVYDVIHPSFTVLVNDDIFSFCSVDYDPSLAVFGPRAAEQIELVKTQPTVEDKPGQDDLLFMTSIPWVSFTSMMHPIHMHPPDSNPRIAWGKYFSEGGQIKMPLSVQAHHALMDGRHAGLYYEKVQQFLNIFDRLV